jgi:hypothetical protein
MQDNFNIHNWQLQQAIAEYRHLLEPVPAPISEDDVAFVWNQLRNRTTARADIIANAAPNANVNSKALDWNDVKAELKGLIVGYMNNHPQEFYYWQGLVQSI